MPTPISHGIQWLRSQATAALFADRGLARFRVRVPQTVRRPPGAPRRQPVDGLDAVIRDL